MGHRNEKQGVTSKKVDRQMTQYLINTSNHAFLRDYIFDEMLWAQAQELEC